MPIDSRLQAARTDAARLAALLSSEHGAMADFILALAAFDASRGWAELGHASLFAFLQRQLHLSNGAAYHRAAAARLARSVPAVAEALRSGRLCLSSTAELAKVLTSENEADVLPRFFGLSAREAREVVAELAPQPCPPAKEVVTVVAAAPRALALLTSEAPNPPTARNHGPVEVPAPKTVEGPLPSELPASACAVAFGGSASAIVSRPPDDAVPLTADLRRLHVTVSRRFLAKLEAARQARSHARPSATTEDLLEEALDLLLAREEKRRTPATAKLRKEPMKAGTSATVTLAAAEPAAPVVSDTNPMLPPAPGEQREHVPAAVRREIWERDQGRCTWPLDGGGTCGSTHRLELDHALASARGGPPTAANLRILCEAHNKEAARRTFGARWMARTQARSRREAG